MIQESKQTISQFQARSDNLKKQDSRMTKGQILAAKVSKILI